MRVRSGVLLLVTLLLSGCALFESRQVHTSTEVSSGTEVVVWNTNYSAAVVIPSAQGSAPKACMQSALALQDTEASIKAKADLELAIEKVQSEGTVNSELEQELKRIQTALNTSTERTSFLQIGAFYLCQLQANGLGEDNLTELMLALIYGSSGLEAAAMNELNEIIESAR